MNGCINCLNYTYMVGSLTFRISRTINRNGKSWLTKQLYAPIETRVS